MQTANIDMDDHALRDPLNYAIASRDGDVMDLVRDALATGRARLAFQPIVTCDDTPKIAFYEGLVRLLDDAERVIPAAHFIH